MEHSAYEAILNELYGDTTPDRRTELLGMLRTDYSTVIKDHDTHTGRISELENDNKGLQVANGQLFRQLGYEGGKPEDKKKEDEKTFSETVTIEQLEKGV